ncbi:MAG TPA: ABC-F family ATP-binding cassette domain-containing protein [Polyangia bacterium]|jgi:ATP-binding cassette subfamily F protein 3|nr:ABC-F family ATP-binding cassette domain-containing protein [Polyangia bacterium]
MLVQLADVDFAYPGTEIFRHLSWQVNPGDRIGLVGPNGAGKSTLLRLIDGQLQPDGGQVARTRGITVAYLHQSQEFHGAGALWDTLLAPFAELLAMREALHALEHRLDDPASLKRYGELQEIYTRRGGYTLEAEVRRLAADLGFTESDLGRSVNTLSGGERGRVELAKVLLAQPDLLLLDEPTNHLDVAAIEHLEERLREWPKAFVVVSHDRYFLRAVCREIVDVEGGGVVRYPGGYDRYVEEREERLERQRVAYERQQEMIAKTEEFIRKNLAGQKTKQAKSRRKMLEKVERIDRPRDEWAEAGNFKLRFAVGEHRGGKEALRTQGLEVGYGDEPPLVKGLDLVIYRGERVGIVGPNGSGKSTLLKALLGKLEPRRGLVERGHEVRIGYFDQRLTDLDDNRSLIEEIRAIRGDWNEDVVRNYLGRFRFSGDEAFRAVKGLSGGERNRLALAKLMLQPRNLLALDEPTNHLDIPACEVLEEALGEYDGTLLIVSHDRYFLDRVATRILHVEGGVVEQHLGNYSDFREWQRSAGGATSVASSPAKSVAPVAPVAPKAAATATPEPTAQSKEARIAEREARKQAARELERKQRRLAELEQQIAQAESELAQAHAALAADHGGDWQRLNSLVAEEQRLANKVRSLMGEWEKLGAELESIGSTEESAG